MSGFPKDTAISHLFQDTSRPKSGRRRLRSQLQSLLIVARIQMANDQEIIGRPQLTSCPARRSQSFQSNTTTWYLNHLQFRCFDFSMRTLVAWKVLELRETAGQCRHCHLLLRTAHFIGWLISCTPLCEQLSFASRCKHAAKRVTKALNALGMFFSILELWVCQEAFASPEPN